MLRPPSLHLVLGLGLLAVAACGESDTPSQPASDFTPVSSPLAALTSNTWTLRAPYPSCSGCDGIGTARISAGVAYNSAGQPIAYTFGGAAEGGGAILLASYNVATDVWKLGDTQVFTYDANGVGNIGGKLYISGGYDRSPPFVEITAKTFAYDPVANTLTRKADMPKASADGITAVIGDKLFVLPGTCSDEATGSGFCDVKPFRRLYRYAPASDHWVSKRQAPHFHRKGSGGAIAGKFYVAGGRDSVGGLVTALDVYDPATDTWKTLAPLPIGGHNIGAVIQGKLFVIVTTESNDQLTNHAYVYNQTTNKWNPKAAPKFAHEALVLVRLDDKPYLLAVGGSRIENGSVVVNDNELYTP
jgi:hypothetical protein